MGTFKKKYEQDNNTDNRITNPGNCVSSKHLNLRMDTGSRESDKKPIF